MGLTGRAGEVWGRSPVQDVVDVIRELGPKALHDREVLYGAYVAHVLAAGRTPASGQAFGRIMSELGCERLTVWKVDPSFLARRWPGLDWGAGA